MSYDYDKDGTRRSMTVNDVTTSYFTDGTVILAQKTGNNLFWFQRDIDGSLLGFTYNGTPYYYLKDQQGSVTGIVDGSGNAVVRYSYDAWGNLLDIIGSQAETLGKQNLFRYSGYYYDEETGLYFLNSRYYDPQAGRFLNPDATIDLSATAGTNNMIAYCGNNPIAYTDSTGKAMVGFVGNEVVRVPSSSKGPSQKAIDCAISYANNKLPTHGQPNSTQKSYGNDGKTRTKREYGPDGKAKRDTDYYGNPKHHKIPHQHDWNWDGDIPSRGPAYIEKMFTGTIIIVASSIANAFILADDITGVGVADDTSLVPLGGLWEQGYVMIFGGLA